MISSLADVGKFVSRAEMADVPLNVREFKEEIWRDLTAFLEKVVLEEVTLF